MIAIRTRILAPTLALVMAGSLALALLALRDSHREIEDIYDAQLVQGARLLESLLQTGVPTAATWTMLAGVFDRAMQPGANGVAAHPYENQLTFQIWTADGQLLARSGNAPRLAEVPPEGLHDVFVNGHEWCGVLVRMADSGLRIWVGERDDLRQDLIQRIVSHTLWPTLVGLPLLVGILWLLLGWGLRPLQDFARGLRERDQHSLAPLPSGPLPPELQPMHSALDHLLAQLRALLDRERRFIADAAHELRTPLAILDLHAQNAQRAQTPEERDEALGYLRQGVSRATRLASQLLTLARLEPGATQVQPLELEPLVREELAELTPLALERQVELVLAAQPGQPVLGDPDAIAIALQNLVTNALAFAPAGSAVEVGIEPGQDDGVLLRVEDRGPGVDEAELARLCDRFYSAGNPQGAGLGLAIVETITRRLGGALSFSNRARGGFCVELRLPRAA
ncbi:ATP-binding protein [Pseudomonas oryzihabitans]|uniref:ATP-binding protein n=1 Tax=Pseudomonas oryzihabitans TaxID=47885 RepID=UPI0011239B3F|nr:ATP-binding protein [Pseudomonas psychrotolerans]QDD89691.1 two-component sensor histidine kinase [Pseudomonas psychrotolerans]